MYHTILVPLDGSERAEAILPHVEELAQRYGAMVIFLRVAEVPPYQMVPEHFDAALYRQQLERVEKQAEDYLAALQGEYQEKGIGAQTRVVHGPVVEAIVSAAEGEDADLVALASHGRSGLSRVFYGSVAAGVLQRIDRPLLLIRSQGDN